MPGLSSIKTISNRFKNFILAMAFVLTQVFVPLNVSGIAHAANEIQASDHKGQLKTAGVTGGYTSGDIKTYTELDSINFRFTLTSSAAASGTIDLVYGSNNGSCTFFQSPFTLGTYDSSAAPVVNVSGTSPSVTKVGSPVANGDEWVQTLNVNFSNAGEAVVNYYLTLTDQAGNCTGSSTHTQFGSTTGAFKNAGAQAVPIPAKDIIELASITVTKYVDDNGDGQSDRTANAGEWNFSLNGGTPVATDANGQVHFTDLTTGDYTIAESGPSSYSFIKVDGTNCVAGSASGTAVASVTAATTAVDASCNFYNGIRPGKIIIEKQTLPDGDTTSFGFTGDLGSFSLSDGQTKDSGSLTPGTYSVAETAMTGWDLTSATCDDGSTPDSIQVSAGETVKCTFTNTKRGSITIVKNTVGGNGTFTFTSDFGVSQLTTVNGTASQIANNLVPGTYSIAETVPSGWDLSSATCDDQSDPNLIDLSAGENVTCTFTNTKRGSITIVKNTVGGDGTFNFTSDFGVSQLTTSSGTTSQTTNNLVPGTYSIAETVPSGWDLTGATCDDQSDPSSIDLSAGETVTCTFTNTKLVSISGTKYVADLDGTKEGTIQDWTIYLLVNGKQVDSAQTLADGSYTFDNLTPGTEYTVVEDTSNTTYTQLYGWDGSTCSSEQYVITLAAGQESANNDFCNFKNGSISGYKWNDQNGDGNVTGDDKLSGWTINLYDDQDQLVDSTITNGSGNYSFTNVAPGFYTVCEVMQDGWVQTYPGTPSTPECHDAVIDQSGEALANKAYSFGNQAHGTITVNKEVVNDNGGMATASDFTLKVNGSSVTNGATNDYVAFNDYTVSESDPTSQGYEQTSLSCKAEGSDTELTASFTLNPNEHVVCTITNDDVAPALTLKKVVVNDNGGTATEANFQAVLNGSNVDWNDASTVMANTSYPLSEYALAGGEGYSASDWNCDGGTLNGDSITLGLAEDVTCTITNDDIAPQLKIYKFVDNQDTNLTKTSADFTMNVDGAKVSSTSFPGSEQGTMVTLNAGDYNVTENADGDYTAAYDGDCTGTIKVGETKYCYVTNTAVRNPAIHVEKDGPSSAYAGDTVRYTFTVTNPGNVPLSGLTVSDDVAGDGATLQSGDVSNPGWLDPGETWIYTVDYKIPASQKGDVVNTVTVCGSENLLVEIFNEREQQLETVPQVCDTDTHTTRILHVLGAATELPNTGQNPLLFIVAGLSFISLAFAVRFGSKAKGTL